MSRDCWKWAVNVKGTFINWIIIIYLKDVWIQEHYHVVCSQPKFRKKLYTKAKIKIYSGEWRVENCKKYCNNIAILTCKKVSQSVLQYLLFPPNIASASAIHFAVIVNNPGHLACRHLLVSYNPWHKLNTIKFFSKNLLKLLVPWIFAKTLDVKYFFKVLVMLAETIKHYFCRSYLHENAKCKIAICLKWRKSKLVEAQ